MSQLKALLRKNFLLFTIRRWKLAIFQLLAPLIFVGLLVWLDSLPKSALDNPFNPFPRILDRPIKRPGQVQKCVEWNVPCVTLRYGWDRKRSAEYNVLLSRMMTFVAEEAALDVGNDCQDVESETAFNDFVRTRPNVTANGLIFHEISSALYNYTIYHNATYDLLALAAPGRKPDNRNELHMAVDRAILRYHNIVFMSNDTRDFSINFSTQSFPQLGFRAGARAIDDRGAVYFYCGLMVQMIVLLYTICQEKDLKIRQSLKIIGLRDSVYWLSFYVLALFYAVIATTVLLCTGYAFKITMFVNVNIFINLSMYILFSLASASLVMLSSVFIGSAKSSLNVGILHFILGVLLISISSKPAIKDLLNDPNSVTPAVSQSLSFIFPAYNLGEAMAELMEVVNKQDRYFDFAAAFQARNKTVRVDPSTTQVIFVPSFAESLMRLVINFFLFGMLAIYLDQVMNDVNGEGQSWLFFLKPSYWTTASKPSNNDDESKALVLADYVSDERYENYTIVQARSIEKAFGNETVLNGVTLVSRENEILVVLGHNGAGKSTFFNILTGLLTANGGVILIDGEQMTRENLERCREKINICPQHDVVWDELTAREHMELICSIKNVSPLSANDEIEQLLTEVQLLKQADHAVGSFSGGMKRRLSVAMAFVGNPRLVILDEPTSGMDIKIKLDIWNLISRMRRNRTIIMTTHSMKEADVLGDQIVILARGNIRAQGTPITLKNRFSGTRLILKTKPKSAAAEDVATQIHAYVVGAKVTSVKQHVVTLSLPANCEQEMLAYLKHNQDHIATASVTQTQLDDVFMAASGGL